MKKPVILTTQTIPQYINILCYAESGTGKTKMIETAPDPLILDAEGGLLTLADQSIDTVNINSRQDLNDVYDWLNGSKEAKDKYQTICTDSLSEVAEVLLAEELLGVKDPRKAYGVMAELMATTIRGYRDLPYHTYFTAKTKKIVDEASGAITYMPSVPGQMLLNNLPYFFDFVLRMEIGKIQGTKEKYRYLDTVGDRRYIAKARGNALLAQEKPDIAYLIDKIIQIGEPIVTPKSAAKSKETKPTVNT